MNIMDNVNLVVYKYYGSAPIHYTDTDFHII